MKNSVSQKTENPPSKQKSMNRKEHSLMFVSRTINLKINPKINLNIILDLVQRVL